MVQNDFRLRAELDLGGAERADIARLPGEEWRLHLEPARIRGANWMRVDLLDESGDDFFSGQVVTSFFRVASGRVQPLWTGLGDHEEVRFDACRLTTRARFSLASDGALVRSRATTRKFRRPGGLATDVLARTRAECLAPRPRRDTFPVDDDGIDADTQVSDELRARARANRLLFIRATRSPKALAAFVADSLALGAWIEAQTDYGGCHQPKAVEPVLRELAEAWDLTPEEIRAAFKPWISARLEEMAGSAGFCDPARERDAIQAALDRNAALLEAKPDLDGGVGQKLRGLTTGPRATFGSIGPR